MRKGYNGQSGIAWPATTLFSGPLWVALAMEAAQNILCAPYDQTIHSYKLKLLFRTP